MLLNSVDRIEVVSRIYNLRGTSYWGYAAIIIQKVRVVFLYRVLNLLFIALECLRNVYLGVDIMANEVLSLQIVRIGSSTYLFECRKGPHVSEIIFQLFL